MKKKIITLIAGALMALSASSAFAAFGDMELIRVYYDRTGAEIATDLGKVSDVLAASKAAGGTTIAGSFGSINTGSTSAFAVYFALDRATNHLWASGSTTTSSVILGGSTGLTSAKSGTNSVYSLYNSVAVGNTATTTAGATSSYKNKLSATQGNLGVAINGPTSKYTELSLANLANNNTQTLYYWNNGLTTDAAAKIGANATDTGFATSIITNADGSTTIVTPTPIPAAAWLLGSGLMGLVGVRRKIKAA